MFFYMYKHIDLDEHFLLGQNCPFVNGLGHLVKKRNSETNNCCLVDENRFMDN